MNSKQAAVSVINTLRDNGHQALFAGGCVRDMLLDRTPKDYDVATSAHPDAVIKLFRRTLEIGAQFGVIMVMVGNEQIEVATFRTEDGYVDGRRPSNVHYSDAQHDASRRDFTINGMFYDPIEEKVLDYVNGQQDLKLQLIKTIGDPIKRFQEDYLRMLRAVRFSAQLGFTIDPDTYNAVCENASKITGISGERIAMEIASILATDSAADAFNMLIDTALLAQIFPELTGQKSQFGISVLDALPSPVELALGLAAVFASYDPTLALAQLKILKLSNADTNRIQFLLQNISALLNSDMSLAQLKKLLATEYFDDLYQLQLAIQTASSQTTDPLTAIKARAKALEGTEIAPKPLLDGNELIALGVKPGPMVGKVGRQMYDAQLNEQLENPDQAKQWLANWLKTHNNA